MISGVVFNDGGLTTGVMTATSDATVDTRLFATIQGASGGRRSPDHEFDTAVHYTGAGKVSSSRHQHRRLANLLLRFTS